MARRGNRQGGDGVRRFDLHAHSQYSPDARGSVKMMALSARAKGVMGLAITDHNDVRSHNEIRRVAKLEACQGMILVPGVELSTAEGHLLGIGIRDRVKERKGLDETIDAVRAAGGVPVISHPVRAINGVGAEAVRRVGSKIRCLEVFNAREYLKGNNRGAHRLALELNLGGTGGSDGHNVVDVGNGYAVTREPCWSVDELLDQLERGRSTGEGSRTPPGQIARQAARNLWLWARRGFHKV